MRTGFSGNHGSPSAIASSEAKNTSDGKYMKKYETLKIYRRINVATKLSNLVGELYPFMCLSFPMQTEAELFARG